MEKYTLILCHSQKEGRAYVRDKPIARKAVIASEPCHVRGLDPAQCFEVVDLLRHETEEAIRLREYVKNRIKG